MENIAIKNGLKYFCHTADDFESFIIENIENKVVSYAQFITNKSLYHASIKECLEHLNGTLKPILYNGKDINPVRDCESIFLSYNPRTGEVYRPIDWEKYYSLINAMEM